MKVLIPYSNFTKQDTFEGSRLRKNIKGALEVNDVQYTVSVVDDYDIVHLFCPDDLAKANDAISQNVPVVVSALSAENDPRTAFLDFKFKDGEISKSLSNKAFKLLSKANLILVPSEGAERFLRSEGIENDIRVLLPGVNLSRFDFSREDEKELFYRYYREDQSKKLVVATSEMDNLEGINAFLMAAKLCPNARFYFFNQSKDGIFPLKAKKIIKKAPSNCVFTTCVSDDIYRSALLNADIFMIPGYRSASVISLLEAMACKCELVVREQALISDLLTDNENAHIAKFSETLATLVRDCLDGKLKPTASDAYKLVKDYTLDYVGEKLKLFYQMEINLRKEIN